MPDFASESVSPMSESHPGNPGVPFKNLRPANEKWAEAMGKDFFKISAQGQSPKTLWIGCSDSRVPPSVITASKPGDIFVQQNIANQFHLDDTNAQSVLSYAVKHLGIKDVVVVGHSSCGGCAASLEASQKDRDPDPMLPSDAPINTWLAPLVLLARSLKNPPLPVLVNANVVVQVENLRKSNTIKENRGVRVHGWVHNLETGELEVVPQAGGSESVE